MEGKLYKSPNGEHYYLTVNGQIFAEIDGCPLKTINQALSLKNCQAIELDYDLDELTNRAFDYMGYHSTVTPHEEKQFKLGYRIAFKEALEILGDKKFSEDDLVSFGKRCFYKGFEKSENDDANCYTAFREEIGELIQSLQQTEWLVEIEMEKEVGTKLHDDGREFFLTDSPRPKLDADGCLILRRC